MLAANVDIFPTVLGFVGRDTLGHDRLGTTLLKSVEKDDQKRIFGALGSLRTVIGRRYKLVYGLKKEKR